MTYQKIARDLYYEELIAGQSSSIMLYWTPATVEKSLDKGMQMGMKRQNRQNDGAHANKVRIAVNSRNLLVIQSLEERTSCRLRGLSQCVFVGHTESLR